MAYKYILLMAVAVICPALHAAEAPPRNQIVEDQLSFMVRATHYNRGQVVEMLGELKKTRPLFPLFGDELRHYTRELMLKHLHDITGRSEEELRAVTYADLRRKSF